MLDVAQVDAMRPGPGHQRFQRPLPPMTKAGAFWMEQVETPTAAHTK